MNIQGCEKMKVAIIGTGAYGLALALTIAENNHQVMMWTKFEEEKRIIEEKHSYDKVLPNIIIPDKIEITLDMKNCLDQAKLIIIAVPAGFVNDICLEMKKWITPDQHICIASKGIEQGTYLFINDVVKKHIKTSKIAVISGPSFAIDIASKMPIGLTLATENNETDLIVKTALENSHFKLRSTTDIYGTEICGAIKNVIAIASGMLNGLKAPESTQAMFITESLHDVKALIKNLDGDGNTILSFAGFGDLLLTCTSKKSRNFTFGHYLATKTQTEIEEYIHTHTIEGLYTLKAIYKLISEKKVDIPIINLIYDIVFHQKNPKELLTFLIEKE